MTARETPRERWLRERTETPKAPLRVVRVARTGQPARKAAVCSCGELIPQLPGRCPNRRCKREIRPDDVAKEMWQDQEDSAA